MSTKTTATNENQQLLEERKVKALEKIGNSLDALTVWFEEIDKDTWGPRIEWYLSLWKDKYIDGDDKNK
jgi:hypothetical protein